MFISKADSTPVDPDFVVKAFLDTNILSYLVDNTYERLSDIISYMRDCKFIELVSSSYVIFEFLGVRKKEHYLRAVLLNSLVVTDGKVDVESFNLSALLKYKDTFASDEVPFNSVKADIRRLVLQDLESVVYDFGVEYENNKFHNNLFEPTKELFLDSQISKEDCFVMCSAVWPDSYVNENRVMFLTNDNQFFTSFSQTASTDFFTSRSVKSPEVLYIKKFGREGRSLPDLTTKTTTSDAAISVLHDIVASYAISNNYFLGYTRSSPGRYPNIVCFTLEKYKELRPKIHLTIVAKDLSFYYTTSVAINVYLNNGIELPLPYVNENEAVDLCFSLDLGLEGLDATYESQTAIELLRKPGNLIFVLPDSYATEYTV